MSRANQVGGSTRRGVWKSSESRLVGGRYRLQAGVLGSGGEGDTFVAIDEESGKPRALKLFRQTSAAAFARVRFEYERLRAVQHPGIVTALDVGKDGDNPYLVTELIAGASISSIAEIADDDQRRARFRQAARQVADALGYLHGRGIVHGDVSPANVRLDGDGRAVLIDLGAAAMAGLGTGGAVGTLGFAAPEALVGRIEPGGDLFALGATLFLAWTGTAPFGVGAAAVARMLAAPAPRLSAVRPGLGEGWDELVASLLHTSPERRPSSARSVLLRLARLDPRAGDEGIVLPPYPAGDPLAGTFVGRQRERAALRSVFERLAEGSCPHAAIACCGVAGSGRAALIGAALEELAIARTAESAPPVDVFRGPLANVWRWLSAGAAQATVVPVESTTPSVEDEDPIRGRDRRFARLVSLLDQRAAAVPLCLALAAGDDETAFARFVAGAPTSGRWVVVLPAGAPLDRLFALDLTLAPLTKADLWLLANRACGEEVPEQAVDRILGTSGGHAATAAILVRQLVDALREGRLDSFAPRADAALDDLLANAFASLPVAARRAIVRVALGTPTDDDDDLAGEDRARHAGWILGQGATARLASDTHRAVVWRGLRQPDLAQQVGRALSQLPADDGRRGVCLEALGRREEAVAAFLAAASGDSGVVWLREADRLAPGSLGTAERITLATAQALGGDLRRAEQTLESGSTEPSRLEPSHRLRLDERRAWLKARRGQLGEARLLLENTLAVGAMAAAPEALAARARLARILVSMGQFGAAVAAAEPCIDAGANDVATEAMVLAQAYGGHFSAARALLHNAQRTRPLPSARGAYLTAFVEHVAGNLPAALEGYRPALGTGEAEGDVHTVAAIALNLGAIAAETGQYGESLAMHDRAIRELGRIGAGGELTTALFNAAMLLTELGDRPAARAQLARLRREGGQRPAATAAAAYLEGELAARAGDDEAALTAFAEARGAAGIDPGLRAAVDLARAESLGRRDRGAEATRILDDLAVEGAPPQLAADVRLVRARLLLAGPALDVDAAVPAARALAQDAAEAARLGRRPRAWRGFLTVARLFHRAGQTSEAAAALASARTLFEEIRMATPTDHHPGLEHDRDARFLADLARLGAGEDPAARARAGRAEDRLRRLLRINKRLNSELRQPRLLELIMDTVIELTEAERGFLLLEDDKGELAVKVARNFDQQTLETGAFELSRSIARQAVSGGAPIVTIDAAGDPRFREALSVSDLHLRSVLAVPLQIKGRAVGTVYVDNRLRRGAFGDDDVQLVLDFAEQAGIAIENARLMSELRRRERQIEVLNRRLEGELAVRKEELSGIKQELRENREALAIRYDYRNIVGRTPRMLELFRLLDRLTDTSLPVVIQGESGTGKELVARALHFNGPRKDRPFVSENCAAIPETLLESTLFGAVRGAYTGADHDTRGLFEVADGGTLFLDEVGEMSAGMQGKLLRVLQTGELRRVGSERMRKVDVRIVAATNRDLGRMVEEGRFRQDLFFRLSVAAIVLPPLRERREDIPAIVDHVLARLAAAGQKAAGKGSAVPAKHVDPAAMARLTAYRWPGNVRELENELMRAAALSGDRIQVADLSPQVAGEAEAALTGLDDPDSLTLRPRVERLERALLREALARNGGNQTRAAEALGLSRFGLQKKMRRYQMGSE